MFFNFQGRYASAPSTLSRNPSCTIFRTSEGRFASVGTSTRSDHMATKKPQQQSQNSLKGRPFQNVEKTCSFIMAILFLLFNAMYWPWLLRDEDFDYAKFTATQQHQLKL
jgi:hypothetical protein